MPCLIVLVVEFDPGNNQFGNTVDTTKYTDRVRRTHTICHTDLIIIIHIGLVVREVLPVTTSQPGLQPVYKVESIYRN